MKKMDVFFLLCRIVALMAGLYHANRFFFPVGGNATGYLADVAVDVVLVYGFWKRPSWFLYFFAVLMLWRCFTEGRIILQLWQINHKVYWKGIAMVWLMSIIFIALVKEKKHASQALTNK